MTLNGSAVVTGSMVSASAIDQGLLIYSPAQHNHSTSSVLAFKVVDDGGTANGGVDTDPVGNSWSADILPVNDEPSGADSTITITEDSVLTLGLSDFGFGDPVDGDAFLE